MASPFRLFRKYVKPLLAVFVVMLMLSWVIGDSLFNWFAGDRNPAAVSRMEARTVAVRWDGGTLTNAQLNDMVVRRRLLNAFLQQVEMIGGRSAYEAGVEPSQLRVQRMLGPETPQQGVEQSVVDTHLFADAARQAGMRVSDEAVVQYLDQLGRGNVTREEMRTILRQMASRGGRMSIDDIINALREEMLAQIYITSNQYAFMTVTPEQRWKDWLRVNERVVIEAAPFPAEQFLVDVKDPTDAELQAYFEKKDENGVAAQDRQASPVVVIGTELPSAVPGFKIPRKIDLAYIEVDYNGYLAKAEEKVTDEEIAKYYEEHKDPMFIKADTGLLEDKGENKASNEGAARPASETKAGESAPADGKASEATPPAEGATQPPVNENKNEEKTDAAKDGKQSLNDGHGKKIFRLAAFQEDASKADAEKKSDAPAADAKGNESNSAPATNTPAANPSASETPPTGETPAAPAAPKKPVEFQPLAEVKDVIRREIAEQTAGEEIRKLAGGIQGQLEADFNKYQGAALTAQADKQPAPPLPESLKNLAPTAEKNGLKFGTTGPKSFLEMRDVPLGKAYAVDANRPLIEVLYSGREPDLFQPLLAQDLDRNHFIVLKTSDTAARVPTLAEVKPEVIKAWKAEKAAELAKKHAEEVAKKAQEANVPLTQFFADDAKVKVVRTDPFSELTGGDVGIVNGQLQRQPYRLSQPEGIVSPGPDFLQAVFKLNDGQVGSAMNNDHSVAYVIRIVEHQPPINELRTAYLAEANNWPGLMVMVQDHAREVASDLSGDITKGANLKWERKKDQELEQEEAAKREREETTSGG
jgi:hypothetical protein